MCIKGDEIAKQPPPQYPITNKSNKCYLPFAEQGK